MVADEISLKTLNTAINGSFQTTRQLGVRNTNAPVDVRVVAIGSTSGRPVEIVLGTSNACVYSLVPLSVRQLNDSQTCPR